MGYFVFAALVVVATMIVAGLLDGGDAVVVPSAKSIPLCMRQAEEIVEEVQQREVESTLAAIEALLAKCRQGGDEEARG